MVFTEEEEELAIKVLSELEERLASHDRNRREVQDRLEAICKDLQEQIEAMATKVNSDLEALYTAEENRLQTLFNGINVRLHKLYTERGHSTETTTPSATPSPATTPPPTHKHKHKHKKHDEKDEKDEKEPSLAQTVAELRDIVTRAEVELQTEMVYTLREPEVGAELSFTDLYRLESQQKLIVRDIELRTRRPHNVKVKRVKGEHIYMKFHDVFNEEETLVLKGSGLDKLIEYRVSYHEDGIDDADDSSDDVTPSNTPISSHNDTGASPHPYQQPLSPSSASISPFGDLLVSSNDTDGGDKGSDDKSKKKDKHSTKKSGNRSITAYLLHAWREPKAWRHEQLLDKEEHSFVPAEPLKADTTYKMKLRVEYAGSVSQWSKETTHSTPHFSELCGWQECREGLFSSKKYVVSPTNPRVVRALYTTSPSSRGCSVPCRAALPSGRTTAWRVRVLGSHGNDGAGMEVGVAPFDVGSDDGHAHTGYGWYLRCEDFTLWSGPPQNYRMKMYALKRTFKEKMKVGCEVGVVVDLMAGTVGFEVHGKSLGVAYEGIPMNKPLVPVVVLSHKDDSVEIIPC